MKKILALVLALAMALANGAEFGKPADTVDTTKPPVITKHPTSEDIIVGDTAYFVAKAEGYETITWYMISPDHFFRYEVPGAADNFERFAAGGEHSTQLEIYDCQLDMDGWEVEAKFTGKGGESITRRCTLNVSLPKDLLWANPSEGHFSYQDQSIQLNAGADDYIYYELTTPDGKLTGTVKSGEYVSIPAIPGVTYDAYLYAYVVDDTANNIICQYVMESPEAPTEEETTETRKTMDGTYRDGAGNSVSLSSGGSAEVSLVGLGWFGGYASLSDSSASLHLTDPNGEEISASFYADGGGYTLYIDSSVWESLESGSMYTGFNKA